MGDHRITIKAEFHMHSVNDKIDWWLNWDDDIPQRVAEWIQENRDKAMEKYYDLTTSEEEKAKEALKQKELSELARLKAKYENN